jgi:hypothetical protein
MYLLQKRTRGHSEDPIWGNRFGNKESKQGAYAKWENYCSISISKDM